MLRPCRCGRLLDHEGPIYLFLEDAHADVVRDLQREDVPLHAGDPADQPPVGDHLVALLEALQIGLVRLLRLLLRPDDHEVEDPEEDRDQEQHVPRSGERGLGRRVGLGKQQREHGGLLCESGPF